LWRRRESNPSGGISVHDGSDALSADSAAKQGELERSASSATGFEMGLSPLRCSNVAKLIAWALEALALGDVDRARTALVMAFDLMSGRPGPPASCPEQTPARWPSADGQVPRSEDDR
jgi:hypothetical protein